MTRSSYEIARLAALLYIDFFLLLFCTKLLTRNLVRRYIGDLELPVEVRGSFSALIGNHIMKKKYVYTAGSVAYVGQGH